MFKKIIFTTVSTYALILSIEANALRNHPRQAYNDEREERRAPTSVTPSVTTNTTNIHTDDHATTAAATIGATTTVTATATPPSDGDDDDDDDSETDDHATTAAATTGATTTVTGNEVKIRQLQLDIQAHQTRIEHIRGRPNSREERQKLEREVVQLSEQLEALESSETI